MRCTASTCASECTRRSAVSAAAADSDGDAQRTEEAKEEACTRHGKRRHAGRIDLESVRSGDSAALASQRHDADAEHRLPAFVSSTGASTVYGWLQLEVGKGSNGASAVPARLRISMIL
eukprot:5636606-Pleurochrysis_carterae.AAC.3